MVRQQTSFIAILSLIGTKGRSKRGRARRGRLRCPRVEAQALRRHAPGRLPPRRGDLCWYGWVRVERGADEQVFVSGPPRRARATPAPALGARPAAPVP